MNKKKEPTIKEMLQSIDSRLHRLEIAVNQIQSDKYSNLMNRRMSDEETIRAFEKRNHEFAFKNMFKGYIEEKYPELKKMHVRRNILLERTFSILNKKENEDEFKNLANVYTQAMMRHHGPVHELKIEDILKSESKRMGNENFFSKIINTIAEEYTNNPQIYKVV